MFEGGIMKYIGLNINSSKDIDGRILNEVKDTIASIFDDSEIYIFKDSNVEDSNTISKIEIMVTLGGDGTIIRTARALYKQGIPILGVNIGNLGFLASIEKKELVNALIQIKEGHYFVEDRMMLNCTVEQKGEILSYESLNDIVISKGTLARMVKY